MKIVVISDTHSYHRKLQIPEADVLVHAGDWTFRGEVSIIEDMIEWAKTLPVKEKIFVAGNHEVGLQYGQKRKYILELFQNAGFHYLENGSIIIDGIVFYGSPSTPFFNNWEFNYNRGRDIRQEWNKIDPFVEVLITHGPAYGTLDLVENSLDNYGRDLHQGCEELAKKITELKQLKLHIFGHIHNAYGSEERDGIKYVNAAICTEKYKPTNPPQVIEI